MKNFPPSLHFLMTCSLESLQSFEMRRLDEAAHLLRKLVELATDLTRAQAEADVARLILVDRQSPAHPMGPTREFQLPALPFRFPVFKPALHVYPQLPHRPLSIQAGHSTFPPSLPRLEPTSFLLVQPIPLVCAT